MYLLQKVSKSFIYLFILFFSLVLNINANTCSQLENLLVNKTSSFHISDLTDERNRFGFELKYDYTNESLQYASDNNTYLKYSRDEDNYLIISAIADRGPFYNSKLILNSGDRIVSLNQKDVSLLTDVEVDNILRTNNTIDFKFQLLHADMDGGYSIRSDYEETFGLASEKISMSFSPNPPTVYTSVVPIDLISVDTKNNKFLLKYNTIAEYSFDISNSNDHELINLFDTLNQEIVCKYSSLSEESMFEKFKLPDPLISLSGKVEDISTFENILTIYNYEDEPFIVYFTNLKTQLSKFDELYDLRLYPFDKQQIVEDYSIAYYNSEIFHIPEIDYSNQLYHRENFLTNYLTPGFNLLDVNYYNNLDAYYSDGDAKSIYGFNIDIKRQSAYYIAKILIPIFLIILLSWSSFWVKNDELEAKLTITIVCFLTLIAYNFVVDSDLPKLHYLTWLDYYILSSYIFTGLTTFSAVYDYVQFRKTQVKSTAFSHNLRASGIFIFIIINLLIFYYIKYQNILLP